MVESPTPEFPLIAEYYFIGGPNRGSQPEASAAYLFVTYFDFQFLAIFLWSVCLFGPANERQNESSF
jgi:hypothetical protein